MTTVIDFYEIRFSLTTLGASLTPEVPPRCDGAEAPDAWPTTDQQGRSTFPGSTIAGSLRDQARQTTPDYVQRLFGAEPTGEPLTSAVRVLGIEPQSDVLEDVRSSAHDRRRGAARSGTLRFTQQVGAGTAYVAYLRVDDLAEDERNAWHEVLTSWTPLLGNGVSSGQGEIEIESIRTGRLDLTTPEGLAMLLRKSGPHLVEEVMQGGAQPITVANREMELWSATFRLIGDLHSWDGTTGGNQGNRANLRMRDGRPVLPGRSIKGIFRSRVEYVLRSVDLGACLEASCGECWACVLFGWQEQARNGRGARARIRMRDAIVEHGAEATREHIGVDRFTGGVAYHPSEDPREEGGGQLYAKQVWRGGEVEFVVERLGATDDQWAIAQALLTLVAWDIHEGFVGIGGSTSRGYGELELLNADKNPRGQAQALLNRLVTQTPAGRASTESAGVGS